jgi:hypothetical protein
VRDACPDYWRSVAGWRIVAITSRLLGGDLPAAGEQIRFVRDAVAGLDKRILALFTHKPPFLHSAAEDGLAGRFVNPAPRRQLLEALGLGRHFFACPVDKAEEPRIVEERALGRRMKVRVGLLPLVGRGMRRNRCSR